jgi:hypothetical protein
MGPLNLKQQLARILMHIAKDGIKLSNLSRPEGIGLFTTIQKGIVVFREVKCKEYVQSYKSYIY